MKDDETRSREEALEELCSFVIQQVQAGVDQSVIAHELVELGMDERDAARLVEEIRARVAQTARHERFTVLSLVPALIGGGLAAIVGGAVWALIVIGTGFMCSWVALCIGLLCGCAVVLFTNRRKGVPLQLIASLTSASGILLGRYIIFFHDLVEAISKENKKEDRPRMYRLVADSTEES